MAFSLTKVLAERPDRGLLALCAAQAILWSLAPTLSHSAPPLDVVEMYAWGREGVAATFKHPNLPGLVLEATRRVGFTEWQSAFVVSQIFVIGTLWAVYALGRELMDGPRALAGALLLTGVYFFSWPSPEFNHNVAQMPLWALTTLFLWRATTRGGAINWLVLGLVAGLSVWAKYSSLVLLLIAGVWMLWDARARSNLLKPGPWLTVFVSAAIIAPQVQWLIAHDWQPFAYAARRAENAGIGDALAFLPVQALNHLPFALLLLAAGFFGKKVDDAPPAPDQRATRFLLLLGLGPAVLTALLGLLGAGLKTAWGAPMFNLSGLLVVALLSQRFTLPRLTRLALGAGVLLVVLPALYFTHMRFGPQITGDVLRGNWPQQRISAALQRQWAEEMQGAPLRVVAGDIWTAGLIGMEQRDAPSVWINCDRSISPWIARHSGEGALIVWREEADNPCGAGDQQVRRLTVPVEHADEPIVLNYAIVPPS